jgi:hypothetical protein
MFKILVFHPRLVGMIKKTISRYFPINVGEGDRRLIVAPGREFVNHHLQLQKVPLGGRQVMFFST